MKTLALYPGLCPVGCASSTPHSAYGGIRLQKQARSMGAAQPDKALPNDDLHKKERARLSPETAIQKGNHP